VRKRTLDTSFTPDWNSPEVIRAMLSVLQNAMSIEDNCHRFIFLTESCIPIYTADEVATKLFQDDCSWLNAFHVPQSKWEAAACFHSVDSSMIPFEASDY